MSDASFPFILDPARPGVAPSPAGPFAKVTARRYHLHPPGIVYTVITLFIVLGAINGQNNLLFWCFGLAVAGLLISGVLSGASLMGVQIRRHEILAGDAGGMLRVRYTIRNKNRIFPCFALTIEEVESKRKRGRKAAAIVPEGAEAWDELLPRPIAYVAHLPPRGVASVEAVVMPWARGRAAFDAVRVSTTFPFGLTLKSVFFSQAQEAIVRPWQPALLPGAIRRLMNLSGQGERTITRRGAGDETYALREYRPGDSPRSVAWRPTARLGQLIVREPAKRSPARLTLVVGPATTPEAHERIVSMAAALIARAGGEGIEMGLAWPNAGLHRPPRAGSADAGRSLDALASARESSANVPPPFTDHSTRVVLHDAGARPPGDDSTAWISVFDPALADPRAWESFPKRPDAGANAQRSGHGWWARAKRLLGGWA